MPGTPDAAVPPPRTSRIVFLDLARAAAVLFMIQGHTIHQLLDPVYESNLLFQAWLFLRGLTSCVFFLLSGFAFSVASNKYWDDLRRPSMRLLKRLLRFAFFLVLGYLIHFPMGRLAHLKFANAERWQSFLQVDVLQLVAGSLLLMQALVVVAGTRKRFAVVSGTIAGLVVLLTPVVWSQSWIGVVPLWLASYLSSETGSNFPFFNWGGFMFFGASLGMVYAQRGLGRPLAQVGRVIGGLGAAVVVAGLVAFYLPYQPLGAVDPWRAGPGMFAIRLGATLVLLSGFVFANEFVKQVPPFVQALSQESLVIYVVHVAVLYGSLWAPGLGTLLGRQGLAMTFVWIVALFVSMTALAWAWNQTKRDRPLLIHLARAVIACALIWPLL